MPLHVFLQIAKIGQRFITLVTTVLFLASVQLHVVLQSATLSEGFVALVASVGLVASVLQHVTLHGARLCEGCVALVTSAVAVTGLPSDQIPCYTEGAATLVPLRSPPAPDHSPSHLVTSRTCNSPVMPFPTVCLTRSAPF